MSQTTFIGLMSGTSMDSIDAVLVQFDPQPQLIATHSHPWPDALRQQMLHLSQHTREQTPLHTLATLDQKTAQVFAEAAMCVHQQLPETRITAIGLSGQTLFHAPDYELPYTWQLGDPNRVAELTEMTVVADFRRRDVAAGGQGAPLATAFHAAMLGDAQCDRVVLNLGGIANITHLPANPLQPVTGFDTGPANALLDAWCQQYQGQMLDHGGQWAAQGHIHKGLLAHLLNDDYFTRPAPKTTGRDYFNLNWLHGYLHQFPNLPAIDVQATLVALTVHSVAWSVALYSPQQLLVCGGGVHNPLLMQGLRQQLPDCEVASVAGYGIDPDWMEALCFAWLAQQRLLQQPNNLPAVTAARHAVCMGAIYI